MSIVGFSLQKINVERNDVRLGKMKVDSNASLRNVEKVSMKLGKSENVLKLSFSHDTKYEPGIGSMTMEGYVLFLESEDRMDELAEAWKKDKKLPKEVMQAVMNKVLNDCSVLGVLLSREINLPPSIPVPKVALK